MLAGVLIGLAGEKAKPGRLGRIRIRRHPRVRDLRPLVVLGWLGLGLGCLAACGWGLYTSWPSMSAERVVLTLGLFMACLVASKFLEPEPEWSNVGLAGGLIDHPLRLSDDTNRFLRSLEVGLIPGRWMVGGIGDALIWLVMRRYRAGAACAPADGAEGATGGAVASAEEDGAGAGRRDQVDWQLEPAWRCGPGGPRQRQPAAPRASARWDSSCRASIPRTSLIAAKAAPAISRSEASSTT